MYSGMHVRVFMPEVNVGIFLSCSLSFKTKSLTEYEAHIFEWEIGTPRLTEMGILLVQTQAL